MDGKAGNQKFLHRPRMEFGEAVILGVAEQMTVNGVGRGIILVKPEAFGRREGIPVAEYTQHASDHPADKIIFKRDVALLADIVLLTDHPAIDGNEIVPLTTITVAFATLAGVAEIGHGIPM